MGLTRPARSTPLLVPAASAAEGSLASSRAASRAATWLGSGRREERRQGALSFSARDSLCTHIHIVAVCRSSRGRVPQAVQLGCVCVCARALLAYL